jgi:hypothetical protein
LKFHRPTAATAIATTALVIAVGGGTAFAATQLGANSVGTTQLKNGAVTNAKVKQYTLSADRFSRTARNELSGSTTTQVMRLGAGRTWQNHSDGTDGNATIDANGAELRGTGANGGLADGSDYAGISTNVLNGKTPADLSTITYTESYTQPDGSQFAAPYFKLKLQPASGDCGDDDVVYNGSVQKDNLEYSGETTTFNVTAPYSTVGVDNDPGPTDGTYPVALHSTSNGAGKDVSGEPICLAEIIMGAGGAGLNDAHSTVYDVTFAGNGVPTRTYAFGS